MDSKKIDQVVESILSEDQRSDRVVADIIAGLNMMSEVAENTAALIRAVTRKGSDSLAADLGGIDNFAALANELREMNRELLNFKSNFMAYEN